MASSFSRPDIEVVTLRERPKAGGAEPPLCGFNVISFLSLISTTLAFPSSSFLGSSITNGSLAVFLNKSPAIKKAPARIMATINSQFKYFLFIKLMIPAFAKNFNCFSVAQKSKSPLYGGFWFTKHGSQDQSLD